MEEVPIRPPSEIDISFQTVCQMKKITFHAALARYLIEAFAIYYSISADFKWWDLMDSF